MSWFSKSIPQRKWLEVSTTLGRNLTREAESWFAVFRQQSPSGRKLSVEKLNDVAIHCVHLLQLQAVSSVVEEGGYISDSIFFLELGYTVLTGKAPNELHHDISGTPFCVAGSAEGSLAL